VKGREPAAKKARFGGRKKRKKEKKDGDKAITSKKNHQENQWPFQRGSDQKKKKGLGSITETRPDN